MRELKVGEIGVLMSDAKTPPLPTKGAIAEVVGALGYWVTTSGQSYGYQIKIPGFMHLDPSYYHHVCGGVFCAEGAIRPLDDPDEFEVDEEQVEITA